MISAVESAFAVFVASSLSSRAAAAAAPNVHERVDRSRQRRDRRGHTVAEHTDFDLETLDEVLDEHLLVVPARERYRLRQ
jgi:hypothetical protein